MSVTRFTIDFDTKDLIALGNTIIKVLKKVGVKINLMQALSVLDHLHTELKAAKEEAENGKDNGDMPRDTN